MANGLTVLPGMIQKLGMNDHKTYDRRISWVYYFKYIHVIF